MKSKGIKCDISNIIMVTLCTLFGVIWSFFVLGFLKDNITVDFRHVAVMSSVTAVSSVCIHKILRCILDKSKNELINYGLVLLIFTVVYIIFVIVTPYSPNHDSYDLEIILKAMKSGENIGDYLRAYMNFFVTNKIVIYIYYPFVLFAKTVEQGVRIANSCFIWVSCVCISVIAGQIKGIRAAAMSLVLMVLLCPVLLFSGPYIYPPAIMLSSMAFVFYMHKEIIIRVFGYIFAGILFTLRPLSLGAFLVYVVCDTFYKSGKFRYKLLNTFLNMTVVFVICFVTQWYIGQLMYVTNIHPSENLDSAMGLWTFEVGTRDQGESTGFCEYSPGGLDEEKTDLISQNFSDLWYLYLKPDGKEQAITELKQKIGGRIIERVKNEIINDSKSFGTFFEKKYSNYYRDYYKPYFYALNINADNSEELLFKNFDYRYALYENVLLVLFYVIGVFGSIGACIRIYQKKRASYNEHTIIVLFIGVICTSLVSILMTEVGKRLIFDSFVPMCVVLSLCLSGTNHKPERKCKALKLSASVLLAGLCIVTQIKLIDSINVPLFKNCDVQIDENRNVFIRLLKPVEHDGYIYVTPESEEFSMKGWDTISIEYNYDEYIARPVLFGIKTPQGQHIYISYLE